MRMFDKEQVMQEVYDRVKQALEEIFPFEGLHRKLILHSINIDDKISSDDIEGQYNAKIGGKSWDVPVYADISLVDKETNKTIDRERKVRLLSLPKITNRFSYIVDGSEYQVPLQMRLKPGVYTRKKGNGLYEGWFKTKTNVFSIYFNPETRKLTFGHKDTKAIPLYSILKKFGYSDEKLREAWGEEVYNTNKKANIDLGVQKLHKTITGEEYENENEGMTRILEEFSQSEMDPEVNDITMGDPIKNITPALLFENSKKILETVRGNIPEDDEESLTFKNIMGLDNFLYKRIHDSIKDITRRIKQQIDTKETVREIISYDVFNKPIKSFFKQAASLSSTAEHGNPLGFLSEHTKITPLGEGGISDERKITSAVQAINPSHLGFIDPAFTPDSAKTGLITHLSLLADKSGSSLTIRVIDHKKNQMVRITPKELMYSNVAFRSEYKLQDKKFIPKNNLVSCSSYGEIDKVKAEDVDYIIPRDEYLFALNTRLVPFLQHNQGNRAQMSAKMVQANVPLVDPERPLVANKFEKGTTEDLIGGLLNQHAPTDGVVESVGENNIVIKDNKGKKHKVGLYNNYPLGSNNFLYSIPSVKEGDKVKKDQMVGRINYTDPSGGYAYGKNLNVGYMSYKGFNTDDGLVISESAAKKLTSEHIYQEKVYVDEHTVLDLKKFRATYPNSIPQKDVDKLDTRGIIKKGSIVKPGQTIAAVLRKEPLSIDNAQYKKVYKKIANPYRDRSIKWEKDYEGKVVEVSRKGKYITINIRTKEPIQLADKITSRHAAKGVITQILPDSEMPHNSKGEPLEVIASPAVVSTRMNVGQILESLASKVADKQGKQYLVNLFPTSGSEKDRLEKIMKKENIPDTEDIYDPHTNKKLGKVLMGKQYIMKQKQKVTSQSSARGGGPSEEYNVHMIPKGGGKSGGQVLGHLGTYAMLAHGAPHNLYEMNTYKSNLNPDFWESFQLGQPIPPPKTPFAYEKFLAYLKGMGLNPEKKGSMLNLLPMTDKDVDVLSNGTIDPTKIIRGKDLKPEKGGLFDEEKTGGEMGDKWTHIKLNDSLPNPVFEDAIMNVTGLTGKEYEDILRGRRGVSESGEVVTEGGARLGNAFKRLLDFNVSKELKKAEENLKNASDQQLSKARKKVKVLKALKNNNMNPKDAYLRKTVPVLPPYFRPIVALDDGGISTDDLNGLYKDIGLINDSYKLAKNLPEKDRAYAYYNLYDSLKSLELVGGTKRGQYHKSIMETLAGRDTPKEGFPQKNLIRRRKQDLSGRGVIVPDPDLSLDEMGLPEDMAWKTFEPMVTRRLVLQGHTPNKVMKMIEDKDPVAKRALERETEERPVIFKRDPVLHKFGVMAMRAKLHDGKSIKVHPLVTDGFGADFDGDTGLYILSIMFEPELSYLFDDNYKSFPTLDGAKLQKIIRTEDFPKTGEPKIKDNKEMYQVPEGIYIHSYDHDTKSVKAVPITEYSIHHDIDFVKVTTNNKKEIITSIDHSLFCMNDTMELVKTKPEESIGYLTPRPRIIDEGKENTADLRNFYEKNHHERTFSIKEEMELNYHTGYIWGLLCGEGWSDDSNHICFSNTDQNVNEYVKEGLNTYISEELNFSEYTTHNQNFSDGKYASVKTITNSIELASLVKNLLGHTAVNKHLPPFFLSSNKEFRLGLLAGLLDGDGTVNIAFSKDKNKPQCNISYCTTSENLSREVSLLATSLGIKSNFYEYEKSGISKGNGNAWYVWFTSSDMAQYKDQLVLKITKKNENLKTIFDWEWGSNNAAAIRHDIVPFNEELKKVLRKKISYKTHKTLYTAISKAKNYITRYTAKKILELVEDDILSIPYGLEFYKWVENTDIFWDVIKSVEFEKTGTGYDFTVPGSFTFMTADQLIVFDTMSSFVPLTPDAVKEATKMFPSNNLFTPSTGKIVFYPRQEAQLGLYLLSKKGKKSNKAYKNSDELLKDFDKGKIPATTAVKVGNKETTAGREFINQQLPKEYRIDYELTPKTMIPLLTKLAKNRPKDYGNVVDNLQKIGFNNSYDSGFSLSLKDFDTVQPEKLDKIWKDTTKKVFGKELSDEKVIEIFNEAKQASDDLITSTLEGKDNSLYEMFKSGAKGKLGSLSQMIGSVGLVQDLFGNTKTYPITGNFVKGLPMDQYWASMHGARRGTVYKVSEVKDPSYETKKITNAVLDQVVVNEDCGTRKGIQMSIEDSEALDRFLSQPIKLEDETISANTLVTSELISRLKKQGIKYITVRTPMKCEQPEGVCQMCMGLDENGKLTEMGARSGIMAAQSIGEPLTQSSLSLFHTGGRASGDVNMLERMKHLVSFPKNLPNKATLSKKYGEVEEINPSSVGGYNVFIKGQKHWVPRELELNVKKGDKVKKGQPLSEGFIDPQELIDLRGVEATQNYITDELHTLFKPHGVRRKNLELIVRSIAGVGKIEDPGSSDYVRGDFAPISKLNAFNSDAGKIKKVPVNKAEGFKLHTSISGIESGKILTKADLKNIKFPEVEVTSPKIKYKPILRGVNTLPLEITEDWLAKVNFKEIKSSLLEAGSTAAGANLHGLNPIPGILSGEDILKAHEMITEGQFK